MAPNVHFTSAIEDFHQARRQAAMQSILSRMTGKRDELLSYEDVRKKLRAVEGSDRQLKEVPVAAIIGSVNRYTDFTRDFLPTRSVSRERWARVKAAAQSMVGLPPIEVYQIGQVYFVQDGNHRVSIARQDGVSHIQAYVKEVHSRVPLSPDLKPDDLIIKAEYVELLECTRLDEVRPQTDLTATSPGSYPFICQQIEAVHAALEDRGASFTDAVIYWHDQVYVPTVEIIRQRDLLRDFPQRTETDLFVWIERYQAELAKELGWDITPDTTALTLASRFGRGSQKFSAWVQNTFENWFAGPQPGKWRETQLAARQGRIFADILVVLTGSQYDQDALDFGAYAAQIEGSQLMGLYLADPRAGTSSTETRRVQADFDRVCAESGVPGKLAFAFDRDPVRPILRRARFANLVVLPIEQQPGKNRRHAALIRKSPTPVLTIHGKTPTTLKKVLLAYDGSPRAEEALFLATYMARFWELDLVVLTVTGKKSVTASTLVTACDYLDHYRVKADLIKASGPPAIATLTFAVEEQCDLIIAGGYGANPIQKLFTGSLVDEVLAKTKKAFLICH